MWIATMTTPDLSFAAHNVAKFSDNPGPTYWKAVRKVMQYLKRTTNYGIVYGGTPSTAASSAWNTSTQESNTRTSSPKNWTQRRLRDMLVFRKFR